MLWLSSLFLPLLVFVATTSHHFPLSSFHLGFHIKTVFFFCHILKILLSTLKKKPKWFSVLTPPGRSYTNLGIISDVLVETFLESFAFWEHWLFNYVLLFRPRCQQDSTRSFTAISKVHGVGGYSICHKRRKVIINTATNPVTTRPVSHIYM